jgi:hypothetical protein
MLGLLLGNVVVVGINAYRCALLSLPHTCTTTAVPNTPLLAADSLVALPVCRARNREENNSDVLFTKLERAQKEHHSREVAGK